MNVFVAVVSAIARMRCAICHAIMNQGERDRNPYTAEGQPVHQTCLDKQKVASPDPDAG
jgi:hypothetical protein